MNKYHILALVSLILAVIFFALSVANGEDSVYIFIFIPVFHINSILSGFGALFLFLAFIFYFLSFTAGFELVGWDELQDELSDRPRQKQDRPPDQQQQPGKKLNIQGGGVIFIGPVPIIFGSNQKITLITVVLALVIMVIAFLFFFFVF